MNAFLEDILAQPAALRLTLESMLNESQSGLAAAASLIGGASRVVLTSMGSALYSLAPMAYALSKLHPNVHLVETSEQMNMPFMPGTLYVIMSRSGESKEIADFAGTLRQRGEPLLAITMTPASTLAKNASLMIFDPAPYDGLICTKAYTSMALIGMLIVSRLENNIDARLVTRLGSTFNWMDEHKDAMLKQIQGIDWLGDSLTFLSRRAGMGLAQCGALWLEESSRLRASYSSIDFYLHGPVEQVDEGFHGVWIDLAPDELSRSQYRDVAGKGGSLICIGPEASGAAGFYIPAFDLPEVYRVLPAAMTVQMIAYQTAAAQGLAAGEMRYLSWVVK
jgi:glucosamine 6-phosphate synthetase-like amidotransferase/phosphosugar isomerase protein